MDSRPSLLRAPEVEVQPPAELLRKIRASVERTPAGTTSLTTRTAVAVTLIPLLAAVVLWVASALVYGRPLVRIDLAMHLVPALLGIASLTLLATVVAVRRGTRGLGTAAGALLVTAVLVVPAYAALTFWAAATPPATALPPIALSPSGLPCISIAGVLGGLVLVALTVALRHSVPVASRLRGAVLGAAAGAWAGLTVFIFCPAGEMQHLVIGHILPVLAFIVAGMLLVPRALRP